eukprot:9387092-Prorocentrum_lima.AAC.1
MEGFTIWETKADFEAWRSGPAFKEAHGGGRAPDLLPPALVAAAHGEWWTHDDSVSSQAGSWPSCKCSSRLP